MSVVDKLRINYLNHTLWGRGDEKLKELLLEEHKLSPQNSMISLMDGVCAKRKVPEVSKMQLDRGLVKRRVKVSDKIEIWVENVMSTSAQNVGTSRMRLSTNFFKLTKRESQALLAWNASAFKLKTSWGEYHEVQDCLAPLCNGRDELEHIKRCPFYKAEWADSFTEDIKQMARYFVALDRERRRKWRGECLF